MSIVEKLKEHSLDFDIELVPVQYIHKEKTRTNSKYRVVVRTDTSESIGVVGNRYTPVPNREAVAFIDDVVGDGLSFGKVVKVSGPINGAELEVVVEFVGDIVIGEYIMKKRISIATSHNGKGAYIAFASPTIEQLGSKPIDLKFESKSLQVKHVSSIHKKLALSDQVLDLMNEFYRGASINFNKMSSVFIDLDEALSICSRSVVGLPKKGNGRIMKVYELSQEMARRYSSGGQISLLNLFVSQASIINNGLKYKTVEETGVFSDRTGINFSGLYKELLLWM